QDVIGERSLFEAEAYVADGCRWNDLDDRQRVAFQAHVVGISEGLSDLNLTVLEGGCTHRRFGDGAEVNLVDECLVPADEATGGARIGYVVGEALDLEVLVGEPLNVAERTGADGLGDGAALTLDLSSRDDDGGCDGVGEGAEQGSGALGEDELHRVAVDSYDVDDLDELRRARTLGAHAVERVLDVLAGHLVAVVEQHAL